MIPRWLIIDASQLFQMPYISLQNSLCQIRVLDPIYGMFTDFETKCAENYKGWTQEKVA